ncbi:hypothetical protein DEM27_08190 [Metarhizobium album]|uniref:Uncharacterized protein n=1 Tax=Metarhizobium album TaxID=2182425 RepID=A0A2U2DSS9_9HYPH|nr:hypothetical protein [Rhizobium album]PWE56370.1 hypothetical protein DEM27_08190 [Rhizobium album]
MGAFIQFFGKLGSITLAVAAVVLAMAAVSATEAVSNLSSWAALLGMDWLAEIVRYPAFDFWLSVIGFCLITAVVSVRVTFWRLSHSLTGRPSHNVSQPKHSVTGIRGDATLALSAFAALEPDNRRVAIFWTSPVTAQGLSLAVDFRPARGPTTRVVLMHHVDVVEKQRVKSFLFDASGQTWRWAGPANEIVLSGALTCLLVLVGSEGDIAAWRFAVADREFREVPKVIGENLFLRPLD